VELPAPGARPEQGAAAAVVESVKAASDVYAPGSGEVIEINQAIVDEPALVNRDPMGKGWLFKIKISDPSQLERLLNEKAYQAMIARNVPPQLQNKVRKRGRRCLPEPPPPILTRAIFHVVTSGRHRRM